jgi:hypothetical protein
MSSGRIVGLVVALAAVGIGVAFAVGAFEDDPPSTTVAAALADTTVTTSPPSSTPTTSVPASTTAEENPLCIAYEEFQTATNGHLPVEGPEDLEAVRTASLAFYTEAVELVDAADQGAFAEFLLYEQAIYDFYEAYEWNPSPPLEELVASPPPTAPATATQTVIQVLEDQCGVVVVTE